MNAPETDTTDSSVNQGTLGPIFASDYLLLDSQQCFVVESAELPKESLRTNTTLAFAIEEMLPADAEDLAIAITSSEPKLIVAVDAARFQAEVVRLESNGAWIAGVVPLALMATQSVVRRSRYKDADIFWQDNEKNCWNWVCVRNGQPVRWRWGQETSVVDEFLSASVEIRQPSHSNLPIVVIGEPSEAELELLRGKGQIIEFGTLSMSDEALQAASVCRRSAYRPWIDLRSSRLKASQPFRPLLAGLTILGVALLLFQQVLLWNLGNLTASQHSTIAESDEEQHRLFRLQYPKAAVPTDIPGRLRSELQKLTKSQSELHSQPPVISALPISVDFLSSLPDDAQFRIDAMSCQSERVSNIDGAVATLDDLQKLVTSLRSARFQFQEPNVTPMRDGFTLRLMNVSRDEKALKKTSATNPSDSNREGQSNSTSTLEKR